MVATRDVSAGRVRNPRGEGVVLGEQIVTAALAFVDDTRGVQGLSLRGLARTVGVSAPAIYAHFPNVDAILLAVARRLFADLAAELRAASATSATPQTRSRAVGQAYLDHAEHHPGRYLVMFGGQWDVTTAIERGALDAAAGDDLGRDVMAAFVGAAQVDGTAADAAQSSVTAAVTTWVTLHGYAHQRLLARAFPWPPGVTEHVLDHALATPR